MEPASESPLNRRFLTVELVTSDGWKLDADLIVHDVASRALVLCHPHPLFGGDRHHPLMTAVADGASAHGIDSIRFDFRRDRGDVQSEVADLIAAVERLREERQYASLAVVGYSFGAAVALEASTRVQLDQLVLVGPPLSLLTSDLAPTVPTTIILGRHDQYCDLQQLMKTEVAARADTIVIEGADHFLHGHIKQVSDTIIDILDTTWNQR